MSLLQNSNAVETGGYNIANSLRFQSASSQYLTRTPATTTSRTTWTWSGWVKRGRLGVSQEIFTSGYILNGSPTPSMADFIEFNSSDKIYCGLGYTGAVNAGAYTSNAVFRDPSAWYHIVITVDTTNATAANRFLLYVNGVNQSVTATTTFALNAQTATNTNNPMNIGRTVPDAFGGAAWNYFDGYQTEINFVDGQALTPSSFGETNTLTGQWVAKKYTGTYGTNGFYLPFSNGTSTTTLGADSSGNSNNWTLTNFTRSAGVSDCWMNDVPSGNGSAGTQPNSNYAVLNNLFVGNSTKPTITKANLAVTSVNNASWYYGIGTVFATSGKWYAEFIQTASNNNNTFVGIVNSNFRDSANLMGNNSDAYGYYGSNGQKYNNSGTGTAYGSTFGLNDVIGVALDLDNGTLTFYKNNVSQGQAFTGITGSWTIACCNIQGGGVNITTDANFGQRAFAYTPPSGFKALCTANLPASTIVKGNQYMDATLWTGNGATGKVVTNAAGFAPDFVWIKDRSAANYHGLFDVIRGAGYALYSNGTFQESAFNAQTLQSFNSNGFTVGTNGDFNTNTNSYVGWQWDAGSSTVTNTSGTISSQVRANPNAGVSVATFTATSGNYSVGHGLGVAPLMTIVKRRDSSGSWWTWHIGIGNNTTDYLELNSTAAEGSAANMWGTVGRNSTVCGFNGTASTVAGGTFVMYNFAEIAGFSKFGSYTGNGSADGTFVATNFKPKFIMCKRSDGISNWNIVDSARVPYNPNNVMLLANGSNAELSSYPVDFLSNGFKMRNTEGGYNTSGATYIYMAFAESPFSFSNAA